MILILRCRCRFGAGSTNFAQEVRESKIEEIVPFEKRRKNLVGKKDRKFAGGKVSSLLLPWQENIASYSFSQRKFLLFSLKMEDGNKTWLLNSSSPGKRKRKSFLSTMPRISNEHSYSFPYYIASITSNMRRVSK